MLSFSVAGLAGAILFLAFAFRKTNTTQERFNEPPSVASKIPLVGHLLGLIRHQVYYYEIMRNRSKGGPILSMPILGAKTYIITAPNLVTAVQRTKTIAFEPVIAGALKGVSGCSKEAENIISKDLNGKPGEEGFLRSFAKTMHGPLSPGVNLNAMNEVALNDLQKSVEALAVEGSRVRLVEWLRHELTLATTNAVYGPANPFLERSVEDAFWTFEEHLMSLIINVAPSMTARTGLAARSIVSRAFETYFGQSQQGKGSTLVRARLDYIRKQGISLKDVAAFEAGGTLALTANTYPVAFWLLQYVFSFPAILQECRAEIEKITTTEAHGISHTIDTAKLKSSCPLLTATLQETMRFVGVGSSVREVVEDTVLEKQWFLRKGMKVITPSNVLHTNTDVWGSDAYEFDHRRFLRGSLNKVAFRAFGGGITLCPGRHFATTEILSIAAVFIMKFDLEPVGDWPNPDRTNSKLWAQIVEPPHDFEVEVRDRQEFKGHKWILGCGDNASVLALAVEDS